MGRKYRLSMVKMTFFPKLLLGIIAMLILITVIAVVSIVSINELESTANNMLEESIDRSSFQKLKLNFQQLLMPANDYLIHGNKVELVNFEQLLSSVQSQITECRETIGHPLEHKALDEFEISFNEVVFLGSKILDIESPIGSPEGAVMMEEMDAIANTAIIQIDELLIETSMDMARYINSNQATNIRATRIIIIVGLFIAFSLIVGGFFYVKEIIKPLKHLSQTAEKISSGDLTAKADVTTRTRDEIDDFARSFNNMIGVLEKTTVSRDYFNNILNRMVDTLIITDTIGNIKIVNKAAIDLLEYTEEEFIGLPMEKILPGENGNEILDNNDITEKLSEQIVQNVHNTYYTKSNKAIPVSFSQSIMHDDRNKMIGKLYIAFHNTEWSQGQQELTEQSSGNGSRNIKTLGEIPLTNRELEIIKLITEDLSNREIADKLFISVRTVETHRKNIMQKLHTKSVIALVHYAAQNGII
jgi:PAS domain S-box-containing protein